MPRAAAGLLALLWACEIERLPDTAADTTRADTTTTLAGAPAGAPASEPASESAAPPTVDTSGGSVALGTGAADVADAATGSGDAPVATAEELATLARALVVPVAGVAADALTDTFDEARGQRRHEAIDILAPRGTPVLSATDGRLLALHTSVPGGLMVYACDETGRFVLLYGHLDRYASGLVEGMPLRRGQPIGTVGTTGNAAPDTPHLHFGIARVADTRQWWRGTPVNPQPLLARPARAP